MNEPLSPVSVAFSAWVAHTHRRLAGTPPPEALLEAAGLVSAALDQGHVCVPMDGALPDSPLVGDGSVPTPLVSDGGRLYLYRYWRLEQQLARALAARVAVIEKVDTEAVQRARDRFFPPPPEPGTVDWQAHAAVTAVTRRLAVVTGGPGTGKTTTVVRILAMLVDLARAEGQPPPSILLLAPTGKAAARLAESIRGARSHLHLSATDQLSIPDEAATIHRGLGWNPANPTRFRHDARHPLPADVVVVDEASMVPLTLMARLVDAVRPEARLVLLGDKDQLASVEPGAALGEICGAGGMVTGVVSLQKSWRFAARPGIGALAAAINAGDGEGALAVLDDPARDEVRLVEPPEGAQTASAARDHLTATLRPLVARGMASYLDTDDPELAFARFQRFRVLCAHRSGVLGVEQVNLLVESLLATRGLPVRAGFYSHRPVLVTTNDYGVRLFNGDVGLVLPESPGSNRLCAWFQGADERVRRVPLGRLPPHETVFAMTVHKSQGSEFDDVLLVLPAQAGAILTRELVYTGVTRARDWVGVYGSRDVMRQAVSTRTIRAGGLGENLDRLLGAHSRA